MDQTDEITESTHLCLQWMDVWTLKASKFTKCFWKRRLYYCSKWNRCSSSWHSCLLFGRF